MNKKLIGEFSSNNLILDLGKVEVLGECLLLEGCPKEISFSLDNVRYFKSTIEVRENKIDFKNLVARFIRFDCEVKIVFYQGVGYIGVANEKWDKVFVQNQYWVGGDGLFSFNLTSKDNYSAKEDETTLCVFGDTFACTLSDDLVRLSPLAMPNNSYCIIHSKNPEKANAEFYICEDEMGHCKAYLEPTNELAYEGTTASNLVNYNKEYIEYNYLSGINPKKEIVIEFDLNGEEEVDYIEVFNYFLQSPIDYRYQDRGVKLLDLYIDDKFVKKVELTKASFELKGMNSTKILINQNCQKVKFVISNEIGVGNFNGANGNEGFFGLNKVYFYRKDKTLIQEVEVKANSEFLKNDKHAWFWLQDGVVIDGHLYSLPYVVTSDTTQPEGFQFRIEGISLIDIDVKDGKVNFANNKQKKTNLYQKSNDVTYNFGCGFYNNSYSSNEVNPDGYVYIYGYLKSLHEFDKGNQLIVARVKEEEFTNINKWKYFNGKEFVSTLEEAKPLVGHVSCELSLHYDSGKYILVFTYDVQSRYIAYATSDTPYGPFSETRIAYVCKENLCPHMYLYNAKAHPHLSNEGDILVSYNINTSNFDENINFGRTYGPRFLNLKRIGGKNDEV